MEPGSAGGVAGPSPDPPPPAAAAAATSPPGRLARYAIAVVLVALLFVSLRLTGFEGERLQRSGRAFVDVLDRSWPPAWPQAGRVAWSLVETIVMAYAGTLLGAMLSLPAAALATRGVMPAWGTLVARFLLNIWRTIPSIVWALFFVAVAGLGPMPGVLALTMYSAGYLTKFYYEAFESADPAVQRALAGLGANRLQVFVHATFPASVPALLGQTIYVFEYNVRAAGILGVVGAGGIGHFLYLYIANLQYREAVGCLILLLVVVSVLDFASSVLRKKLVE